MSYILGLDASTETTGFCLYDVKAHCLRFFDQYQGKDTADQSLSARIERIADTRYYLERFKANLLRDYPQYADFVVAYELHTGRGRAPSEALSMASGAYLSVFAGHEVIAIDPMTAKSVWGGTRYRSQEAKEGVAAWVRREFRLHCVADWHHAADSVAVAVAAAGELKRRAQLQLVGPRGGKF